MVRRWVSEVKLAIPVLVAAVPCLRPPVPVASGLTRPTAQTSAPGTQALLGLAFPMTSPSFVQGLTGVLRAPALGWLCQKASLQHPLGWQVAL